MRPVPFEDLRVDRETRAALEAYEVALVPQAAWEKSVLVRKLYAAYGAVGQTFWAGPVRLFAICCTLLELAENEAGSEFGKRVARGLLVACVKGGEFAFKRFKLCLQASVLVVKLEGFLLAREKFIEHAAKGDLGVRVVRIAKQLLDEYNCVRDCHQRGMCACQDGFDYCHVQNYTT